MMKKLLFCLFLLLPSVLTQRLWAEGWALVVLHADGNRSTFLLSEKPEVTFSGSDCVFSSESATVTLARTSIADFHFEDAALGIGKVKSGDTLFRIVGKGIVSLVNVSSSAVRVYDLQGKSVKAGIATDGQNTVVSLEQLPSGVYVISYLGNVIKVKR